MPNPTMKKFQTTKSLKETIEASKKRVVMAGGVFDLLHAGHHHLLQEAKSWATNTFMEEVFLVAAVNSDESTRRLKGPSRPIQTLGVRLDALAEVPVVDAVIGFEEDTPLRLLQEVPVDVFVKGSDWVKAENEFEFKRIQELGINLFFIPRLSEYSTTKAIEQLSWLSSVL